jgi:hypothetical protein
MKDFGFRFRYGPGVMVVYGMACGFAWSLKANQTGITQPRNDKRYLDETFEVNDETRRLSKVPIKR